MTGDEQEKRFLEQVKRDLDDGADNLDEATLLRLRHARQQALAAAERKRWWFVVPKWVTAGGIATAMVLVVAVSFWYRGGREGIPLYHTEDVEILVAQENMEISKDLEFYRWLTAVDNER